MPVGRTSGLTRRFILQPAKGLPTLLIGLTPVRYHFLMFQVKGKLVFQRLFRFSLPLALTSALMSFVMLALAFSAGQSANMLEPVADAQPVDASQSFTITLVPVVTTDLLQPVHLTHAGDGSGRLFVVERAGRIRVIKNGALLSEPFLNISSLVQDASGEQGLLSVAFDPDYASNGTFYVDYTGLSGIGDTVIARYVVSHPSADVANLVAATNILTITQPEVNHNGGQLQFGPKDGYLYIGMGDGGGGGDQHGTIGNAQDRSKLLGKLLRINVRGVPTYTIPTTNPFTQTSGARPEVWAYGLRNPWRFSFDRVTGDLYIGDVGQGCFEEVDYQPASSPGGENYGWRLMEGFHQFDPNDMANCSQPVIAPLGLTLPITDYIHPEGEAVVGGYVYRGNQFSQLRGAYFYGDDVSGKLWALQQASPGHWASSLAASTSLAISSFGEDESGELYVVDLKGGVYKIVSSPSAVLPDLSGSAKRASTVSVRTGDVVTYSILLTNSGGPVTSTIRITDTIPAGLNYRPGSVTATSGIVNSSQLPTITWHSPPPASFPITLTYAVTVSFASTLTIENVVVIDTGFSQPFARSAVILVNPYKMVLPLVLRNETISH